MKKGFFFSHDVRLICARFLLVKEGKKTDCRSATILRCASLREARVSKLFGWTCQHNASSVLAPVCFRRLCMLQDSFVNQGCGETLQTHKQRERNRISRRRQNSAACVSQLFVSSFFFLLGFATLSPCIIMCVNTMRRQRRAARFRSQTETNLVANFTQISPVFRKITRISLSPSKYPHSFGMILRDNGMRLCFSKQTDTVLCKWYAAAPRIWSIGQA